MAQTTLLCGFEKKTVASVPQLSLTAQGIAAILKQSAIVPQRVHVNGANDLDGADFGPYRHALRA